MISHQILGKKMFNFPFGQPLNRVTQTDRTPKKVFVLGVYASAVHARWVDNNGKQIVAALAVASEPKIFWRGDDAEAIIKKINVPYKVGTLTIPTHKDLNGPSGKALDDLFLVPLGYRREDAWLCDLLPESRVNLKQREAIDKYYIPLCGEFDLPAPTIPDFDENELNSDQRRREILDEVKESQANTLILLGDLPVRWFLRYFTEEKYSKLSDFGDTQETYGMPHRLDVAGLPISVIPLCHPRQAAKLGSSSSKWGRLHEGWVKKMKNQI